MRRVYFCLVCWFSIITAVFILCSNLIFLPILLAQDLSPPTVSTGEATDVTSSSATLNGTSSSQRVPNAWFEYGTVSGSYDNSVSAEVTFGVSKNVWKASINGLSSATIYYYRIAANDSYPGYTTDTAYGSEKSFTTLAATPTVTATITVTPTAELTPLITPSLTPTVTPISVCEIESVGVSLKRLILKRGKSREVTVNLKGKNDCSTEGKIITATISKMGSRRVSVIPTSQVTDENDTAEFIITAGNKVGNARVTFKADSQKISLTVKVR